MIVAGQRQPILIATRPVDFRCGHRALALIVQTELKLDPHSGVTIVFRSKRGDRMKILVWDGTGLAPLGTLLRNTLSGSGWSTKSWNRAALPGRRFRTGQCGCRGRSMRLCSRVSTGAGS